MQTEPAAAASEWRVVPTDLAERSALEEALRERIKELNCLYGLARIAADRPESLDDVLPRVVDLLPPAWQYPEIAVAEIVLYGSTFSSRDFRNTPWVQTAQIVTQDGVIGRVSVSYLEARPSADEGPFLHEERILLEAVAERLGAMAKRLLAQQGLRETNRKLRLERKALEEANSALRAVLSQIEAEKEAIRRQIKANVENGVMPMIAALLTETPKARQRRIELLRDTLEEITAPFIGRLHEEYRSLSPAEMAVCKLIRSGLTSKEVAQMRGVSPGTIRRQREDIRRKLGLTGRPTNLASYLQGI